MDNHNILEYPCLLSFRDSFVRVVEIWRGSDPYKALTLF